MTRRYQLVVEYKDHVIVLETDSTSIIFEKRIKIKI